MARVPLRDLAFSRAGDKGDVVNVSVIPYDEGDYELLLEQVTEERVRERFEGLVLGAVRRYEVPGIRALNFVLENALGGGVSRSLALDAHGKSYASLMLMIEVEVGKG